MHGRSSRTTLHIIHSPAMSARCITMQLLPAVLGQLATGWKGPATARQHMHATMQLCTANNLNMQPCHQQHHRGYNHRTHARLLHRHNYTPCWPPNRLHTVQTPPPNQRRSSVVNTRPLKRPMLQLQLSKTRGSKILLGNHTAADFRRMHLTLPCWPVQSTVHVLLLSTLQHATRSSCSSRND